MATAVNKRYLSVSEAALELRISKASVYQAIEAGHLPASSTPWWKLDEELAYGVGKAFVKPIRIKSFEV
jgi:Helix-turn-helix domain